MFNHILNIFKQKAPHKKHIKENYYNQQFRKAIEYQKNGNFKEALEIYKELYIKLAQDNCQKKLAIVLNNMIVVRKKLNYEAKGLFKKLLKLRFSLVMQYEELYTIDYIYTLLMGVEWFNLPKDKLSQAESLLEMYSEFSIYQPTLERINKLRAVA